MIQCKDITKTTIFFQKCFNEFIKQVPKMTIVETLRTLDRQKYLVATKKSKTLKSNHLFGRACDLVPTLKGYNTPLNEWITFHDKWDAIVTKFGGVPEKRIEWDYGHFGIIKEPK